MPLYPKRLIEVDLPIRRISAHARREKSIRHGHISTLHIWWARRPLAACRAVLCASLWPDPADPLCPEKFIEVAKKEMLSWARNHLDLLSSETMSRFVKIQKKPSLLEKREELQKALFDFIADFANWDNATNPHYLHTSRLLTQAAHESLGGIEGTRPLVVDPFAGGGAIPLEALRVGADAFASDLNPVAVLLNKVVLEYIPRYGEALARKVEKWGRHIKEQAEKELSKFYPSDSGGATPIAYLWARTVQCEGPGCGAEIPLMRSFYLAKKGKKSVGLKIIKNKNSVDFEIINNPGPKEMSGTVQRGSATCPLCGYTTPVASVRRQLKPRKGGASDARLVAVVTTRPKEQGRFYRLPNNADLKAVEKAAKELKKREKAHKGELSLVPDEETPQGGGSGAGRAFSQRNYGMILWKDLFTPRQALSLTTLVKWVQNVGEMLQREEDSGLAEAVQTCLALAVDRVADRCSSLCRYDPSPTMSGINNTFSRHALPIIWDFGEGIPIIDRSGGWNQCVDWVVKVLNSNSILSHTGQAQCASATSHPLPDGGANCFFTDPPYYDAIPYADLSDFFVVWLKRSLNETNSFANIHLAPKEEECIVDEIKSKDKEYFEISMQKAMEEGSRVISELGIGTIVFAHKSTAGWEAMLNAVIQGKWTITASWPIDTEMGTRLRAMNSAALASSIHLVCRPRQEEKVGDWRDVLRELPRRIHEWMPRLSREGVVGADAIFACLGPALEVFSRYSRVEKVSGEVVPLKEYLEAVWAAVSKEALDMIFDGADASGLEEDARLSAMWLWTLSTNGNEEETQEDQEEEEGAGKVKKSQGFFLEFDAARKIAQGLGAHLEDLSTLVETQGDKARLLPVSERTRYLFGKEEVPKTRKKKGQGQISLFEGLEEVEEETAGKFKIQPGKTALDRIHQSMILFGTGRGEALKRFLMEDGGDEKFWRLARALSALYPFHTEEKRWIDGVLARKKSLGV